MTLQGCPEHTDYARASCESCHALRSSVALRVIQGDLDEARRAFRFDELMEEIERHLKGDVRADD